MLNMKNFVDRGIHMKNEEGKSDLLKEYEWLDKAIEMLNYRLIDRGFNINQEWLGYHDKYVLHYVPQTYINNRGKEEALEWGILEVHCKKKVFNPYKYCNGNGVEYKKLNEFSIYKKQWEVMEKYIRFNDYKVGEKNVCFDNPYPRPRVEFYQDSDVPINGNYE